MINYKDILDSIIEEELDKNMNINDKLKDNTIVLAYYLDLLKWC